jgi:hypothetical protein
MREASNYPGDANIGVISALLADFGIIAIEGSQTREFYGKYKRLLI